MTIELETIDEDAQAVNRLPTVLVFCSHEPLSPSDTAFLKAQLARCGVLPNQAFDLAARCVFQRTFRWPRNVAWTDYPIVDGPFYKPQCDFALQRLPLSWLPDESARVGWTRNTGQTITNDWQLFSGMVAEARWAIVIGRDRILDASDCLDRCGSRAEMIGFDAWGGIEFDNMLEVADHDQAEEHLSARWQWSWTVNARALFPHVLRASFDTAGVPMPIRLANGWGPVFSSVAAIETMFALVAKGPGMDVGTWPFPGSNEISHGPGFLEHISGVPGIETDADGKVVHVWRGTGAREPRIEVAGTRNDRRVRATINLVNELRRDRMVEVDTGGELRLSVAGRCFLELLHPAFNDPDVPLRWRSNLEDRIDPVHGEAVDRWLKHAFRKLKVRINRMPKDGSTSPILSARNGVP